MWKSAGRNIRMFRSRSRLRMSAKTLRTLCASLAEGVVRRSRRVAVSPVFFPCVPLCPLAVRPFLPGFEVLGQNRQRLSQVYALSQTSVGLPLPDALYHKHDGFLMQAAARPTEDRRV